MQCTLVRLDVISLNTVTTVYLRSDWLEFLCNGIKKTVSLCMSEHWKRKAYFLMDWPKLWYSMKIIWIPWSILWCSLILDFSTEFVQFLQIEMFEGNGDTNLLLEMPFYTVLVTLITREMFSFDLIPRGGGGVFPYMGSIGFVRPQRVWLLSRFGHK